MRGLCSGKMIGVLMAGTAICAVGSAWAQSPPSSENEARPADIIVTAGKREERLKDVPMAVDVATGEQIEKFNLFDFKDVPALAPGLQIANTSGRVSVATLRGISFNPDIGGPAAVAVYYNEVPVDIQTVTTAIYDIGQVEVLRGPQGTLRGRTAPAGAITVTTRRADLSEPEGYLQATVTNKHARNFQIAASTPLIQDKLAIRIAAVLDRNRANHVYNITRDEWSNQETESVRATLSFAPTERLRGNIVYQYLESDLLQSRAVQGPGNRPSLFSPFVSGPPISASDRLAVHEGLSFYTNRTHLVTADASYDLGSHLISVLGGFQDTSLHSRTDQDVGNAVQGYDQVLTVPDPTRVYTAEARISSAFEGMFNYTLGVFYNQTKAGGLSSIRVDSFFANRVPNTPFPASVASLPLLAEVDITNKTSDLAFFGQTRLKLTDKLRVELGARYTRTVATAQSFLEVTTTGGVGFVPVPAGVVVPRAATVDPEFVRQVNHPLTGTASVSYDWTPDITTYATYGRSYRRGSAQLGVNSPLDSDLLVLEPERSDAIEVGLKAQLFDKRVSLNLAAFYQKFDGFVGLVTAPTASARDGVIDGSAASISFNGDAISKGVEMQLDARPIDEWDISINASYANSHYDNATVPCRDSNGDGVPDTAGQPAVPIGQQVAFCTSNDRLANIPRFALSANSELRFSAGSIQPFIRGLLTYRPGFYAQAADYRYKSITNVNLFAGIRSPDAGWELTAFVKNLFNSTQITNASTAELQIATRFLVPGPAGNPTPFRSGYTNVSVNPPREFGVTMNYRF